MQIKGASEPSEFYRELITISLGWLWSVICQVTPDKVWKKKTQTVFRHKASLRYGPCAPRIGLFKELLCLVSSLHTVIRLNQKTNSSSAYMCYRNTDLQHCIPDLEHYRGENWGSLVSSDRCVYSTCKGLWTIQIVVQAAATIEEGLQTITKISSKCGVIQIEENAHQALVSPKVMQIQNNNNEGHRRSALQRQNCYIFSRSWL